MITYAITTCNEHIELDKLLKQLCYTDSIINNQILIQYDSDSVTKEVMEVIFKYEKDYVGEYDITGYPLNRNFASFKNNLFEYAKGNWIFQIDADEFLSENLLFNLPMLLEDSDPDIELIRLSRVNIVNGITQQHIDLYRWNVEKTDIGDIINFPDLQSRIYRNKPDIRWANPVHEIIVGYKAYSDLIDIDWSLIHIKDIARQEKQNQFYSTIR